MDIFVSTFQAVAILLGIGLIGFWVISRKVLATDALRALNPLAINIALPSLVFVNILRRFDPETRPDWWTLPLWWCGFTAVALVFSLAASRLAARPNRREFACSLFYENALFFPLIIIVELYGPNSPLIMDLFVFQVLFGSLLYGTYRFFFHRRAERVRWSGMLNAVFVATVSGLALRLLGRHEAVPSFVVQALEMVGGMTTPLLMLIFGGNIYLDLRERMDFGLAEVAKFVLAKNFALPLVVLGALMAVRPDRDVALLILLAAAVPPIASIPIFVERAGGNRRVASQFVLASFLCSILSIPVMMWLFDAVANAG